MGLGDGQRGQAQAGQAVPGGAIETAGALDLQLEPGELALIDARDLPLASGFADLCCGLHHPADGEVRFLQRDWSRQPGEMADALRGLIGRVMANPGWLRFLDATTNVLLQQIHHTRSELDTLREGAASLATHFGLPGLPNGPMGELSAGDVDMRTVVIIGSSTTTIFPKADGTSWVYTPRWYGTRPQGPGGS